MWQPIESAPRDGTSVLVATAEGLVGEAKFYPDNATWYWMGFDPSDYVDGSITPAPPHWMPLPPPPTE